MAFVMQAQQIANLTFWTNNLGPQVYRLTISSSPANPQFPLVVLGSSFPTAILFEGPR